MNKRGFFSAGTFLISFTIIILAISLLFFQANPSIKENPISDLKWKEINGDKNNTLTIIVFNFVNFLGDSMFRIAGEISNWAYYNQNIVSPDLLITLLILFLLVPIIVALFKLLIIVFILIKEYIQSRKEKKQIKKLKENENKK